MTLISHQIGLGWEDAWLHERRAPDGRWVRGAGYEETVKFDPGLSDWARYKGPITEDEKTGATAEVQKAMDRQRKIVPGIVDRQDFIFTDQIPDAPSEEDVKGETMPDGRIFIRPDITAAVSGAAAARRMEKEQEGERYWVPIGKGRTMADAVISHEMGHVVGAHLMKANPGTITSIGYWKPLADAIGILPPPAGKNGRISLRELADWADQNYYALATAVSVYGASSPYEMQGELWSEYTTSPHPRPAAVAFGKYVLEHLPAKDLAPVKETP